MDFNTSGNSSTRIATVSSPKTKKKTLPNDWLRVHLDNSRQQDSCKKQFTAIYLSDYKNLKFSLDPQPKWK